MYILQAATNNNPITIYAFLRPTYRRYQFTDPEGMDSLVSYGRLYAHNLYPSLLYNWIEMHRKEMNPDCWARDQLNTSSHAKRKGPKN